MWCAFGAHLDVGLAERRAMCRFVGNLTFPSLFLRDDGRLEEDGFAGYEPCVRAEESSDFIEAHCGVSSRERPYEIVTYLYVCVFDL